MPYDFGTIESKWLQRWEKDKIFQPTETGKKYLLTVPYPYANGALHIGHGRTYTIGDIMARYLRMKGYNVLYPMGFHISGTPILGFAKKIEKGDRGTIELYKSYLELYGDNPDLIKEFSKPENIANYFANKIISDFSNMGFSIDWSRVFNTGEPIYNKFIEWQFRKLFSMGLIKQGDYPILYSIAEGNPVGEDDIADGDVDKVSILEFVTVLFKFGDKYLGASTLRPETLEGVTNLFVNPDRKYVIIELQGKKVVVSKEAAEKLQYQGEIKILEEIDAEELIGKEAAEPLHGRSIPIFGAKFVDTDNATGIVYSVPAHSIQDFLALKDLGIEINPIQVIGGINENVEEVIRKFKISSIDETEKIDEATKYLYEMEFYHGIINKGKYAGKWIRDIKEEIKNDYIRDGIAFIFYETSRKAVTRDGDKVIVAIIKNQWFLDYSNVQWKEKVRKLLEKMELKPESLRNQFMQVVDWIRERPCARKRGLGTRLPMDRNWVIESLSDSTIYPALYTIIRELREMDFDEIDDEIFDYIFFGNGELKGKSDRTVELCKKARKEFEFWYPVDWRHTGYPHISNHLTFYLFNHVAIFPENYWPKGISTGGIVLSEGQKMAKSKGNVVPLLTVKRKYGADLFRLYFATNADVWYDVDWRSSEVNMMQKKLEKFYEYLTNATNYKDEPEERDLWIIGKFNERLKRADDAFKEMRIREAAVELFYNMLNDVQELESIAGRDRTMRAIRKFGKEWALSLSPIIPFISEEVNEIYGGSSYASLSPYPNYNDNYKNILEDWEYVEDLLEDFKNITKIYPNKPNKMKIYLAEDWKKEVLLEFNKLGLKDFMKSATPEQREFILSVIKRKDAKNLRMNVDELKVLEMYKEDLENYLKIKIEIMKTAKDEKSKKALPGKPAIILE